MADGAGATVSTFQVAAGPATARAIRVSPEAGGVVVEGNDFTGISHAQPILDRGVGTVVAANTGA
jgi:hypothetical protein